MDRRTFLKTTGVAAGVASAGVGLSRFDPDPDTATASAAELPEEGVELLTDEYNVTHVYGEDLYSLGYGQGYAQARDRLFQIHLLRTVGRGTSSTVIGPSQVGSDTSVKQGLYNDEELAKQWETAADDTRKMIRGYTDGVNDKMAERETAGELPGEFTLLGVDPSSWQPTDTVAVITYTIGRFGVGGGSELGNAGDLITLRDWFDSDQAAWEAYHDFNSIVVPDHHYGSVRADAVEPTDERVIENYADVPDEQKTAIEAARTTEDWGIDKDEYSGIQDVFLHSAGVFEGLQFGSNAIIVGGEHTDDGRPMLGGGPQMGLFKPPIIHEIGLHTSEFNAAGVGVVGAPGMVVGRTDNYAWTVTTSGDDMQDTIAVTLDPEDRYRYEWDGEFYEFVTEEYVHEPNMWAGVVDGTMSPERVEQEVAYIDLVREDGSLTPIEENNVDRRDVRMPVVDYNPEENVAFVKRTASRMDEIEGAFMWANVARANGREEFEDSLADFPFGFNFHYIDDEDIAYYRTGKLPQRNESEVDPRFPTPQEYHDWEGFDVGLETPGRDESAGIGATALNPERGYVVNWNNAPAPGWRNSDSDLQWNGVQRVDILDRLTKEKIIETDDDLSIEDADGIELPADASGSLVLADVETIIERASVEQPYAPNIVPYLVAAARESDDGQLQAMADELETWADADDLGRFTGPDTLGRWLETTYSYRPGEDGHYPNGGMAIYEEIRYQLAELMFEEPLDGGPRPNFEPGSGLSGADPHAADHGTGGSSVILLVNNLEGRTNFEWLADHGDAFQLVNEATGEAMALDTSSAWWEWLFEDDAIRQTRPADRDEQYWQARDADGNPTFGPGTERELHSVATGYAAGLDGAAGERGATVSPTGSQPQRFDFRPAGDGTYHVCTAESGLALQPADDGTVCQEPLDDAPRQRWRVELLQAETTHADVLRRAMTAAAEVLADRFGSDDPSEWLLENRQSSFFPLGGTSSVSISMTNRASYQQSIKMGSDGVVTARSVLPPSNTGHVNTWELLATQFGNEPDRLTEQLALYDNFEFTQHPVKREAVEKRATDSTNLG